MALYSKEAELYLHYTDELLNLYRCYSTTYRGVTIEQKDGFYYVFNAGHRFLCDAQKAVDNSYLALSDSIVNS
jgi:hypothetical protein